MVIKPNIVFLIAFLFLMIGNLAAETIQYNLNVSKKSVQTGEMFQVNLEIFNTRGVSVSPIGENPDIFIKETGKSSTFRIVNGQQGSSLTITYIARINKVGKYEIGPFQIKTKNETIETTSVAVEVLESSETASMASQAGTIPECFIKVTVSEMDPYVNEYVDVSVKFYTSVETRVNDYQQLVFPNHTWIENIKPDDDFRGKIQIDHVSYDEYEIEKKRIFISQPGAYEIKPVVLNLYIFSRTTMFSYYRTPTSIRSEPIVLNVKPLPPPEKSMVLPKTKIIPIGTFSMNITFSSLDVLENTPVTMNVILNGSGNFHSIDQLEFDFGKDVEVFSSKSNLIKNMNSPVGKKWEILLIPKVVGEIPLVVKDFVFFDTEKQRYETIPEQKFLLTAKKDSNRQNATLTPVSDLLSKNRGEIKQENHSEMLISNVLGKKDRSPIIRWNILVMSCLYILFLMIIGIFLFYQYGVKYYISQKTGKPIQILEKGIGKLQHNLDKNRYQESTEQLYQLLELFLTKQFQIDSVDITKNTLKEKLDGKLPEEKIAELIELIGEFDLIRFSGLDITELSLNTLIKNVSKICSDISTNNKI